MPCFSIFSQIEHDLIQFIKQSYSPISPKEVQVLKHIVYDMLDGNCLSVNPDMIVIDRTKLAYSVHAEHTGKITAVYLYQINEDQYATLF